uniref:G_PROTEIN_RECEP_F1_2 domain-containing protein n=1 Tax=Macrostomum lignano TaxID=282301 RepID=A0A1I8H754_9PLAT
MLADSSAGFRLTVTSVGIPDAKTRACPATKTSTKALAPSSLSSPAASAPTDSGAGAGANLLGADEVEQLRRCTFRRAAPPLMPPHSLPMSAIDGGAPAAGSATSAALMPLTTWCLPVEALCDGLANCPDSTDEQPICRRDVSLMSRLLSLGVAASVAMGVGAVALGMGCVLGLACCCYRALSSEPPPNTASAVPNAAMTTLHHSPGQAQHLLQLQHQQRLLLPARQSPFAKHHADVDALNLGTVAHVVLLRDCISNHYGFENASINTIDGRPAENAVHTDGVHPGGAGLLQLLGRDHPVNFVRLLALLVNQGELHFEPFGYGGDPFCAASVWANDDRVLPAGHVLHDPLDHGWLRVQIVHRDVEEALCMANSRTYLYLGGVQVHGDNVVSARYAQHIGHQLGGYWGPGFVLFVLPSGKQGITAVTRAAEAVLQALIMISSSMSMSFTSPEPVWMIPWHYHMMMEQIRAQGEAEDELRCLRYVVLVGIRHDRGEKLCGARSGSRRKAAPGQTRVTVIVPSLAVPVALAVCQARDRLPNTGRPTPRGMTQSGFMFRRMASYVTLQRHCIAIDSFDDPKAVGSNGHLSVAFSAVSEHHLAVSEQPFVDRPPAVLAFYRGGIDSLRLKRSTSTFAAGMEAGKPNLRRSKALIGWRERRELLERDLLTYKCTARNAEEWPSGLKFLSFQTDRRIDLRYSVTIELFLQRQRQQSLLCQTNTRNSLGEKEEIKSNCTTTRAINRQSRSVQAPQMNNSSLEQQLQDHRQHHPVWMKPVFLIFYAIICVLGTLGNLLVVFVVLRKRSMQTITNILITNLAISDVIMSTVNVPLTPAIMFMGNWTLPVAMCKVMPMTMGVSVYVSTLTSTAIAVDRYLVIVHPFVPRMKPILCLLLVLVIWLVALLISLPIAVFQKVKVSPEAATESCVEDWKPEHRPVFTVVSFLLQFLLPCCVITVCYARVSARLSRRRRRQNANYATGGKSSAREAQDVRRKRRTNRMLIAMVTIFVVCWIPLNLLWMLKDVNLVVEKNFHVPFFACHLLAMSSVMYNPFLYGWMNANFKARRNCHTEFRILLPCLFPKRCSNGGGNGGRGGTGGAGSAGGGGGGGGAASCRGRSHRGCNLADADFDDGSALYCDDDCENAGEPCFETLSTFDQSRNQCEGCRAAGKAADDASVNAPKAVEMAGHDGDVEEVDLLLDCGTSGDGVEIPLRPLGTAAGADIGLHLAKYLSVQFQCYLRDSEFYRFDSLLPLFDRLCRSGLSSLPYPGARHALGGACRPREPSVALQVLVDAGHETVKAPELLASGERYWCCHRAVLAEEANVHLAGGQAALGPIGRLGALDRGAIRLHRGRHGNGVAASIGPVERTVAAVESGAAAAATSAAATTAASQLGGQALSFETLRRQLPGQPLDLGLELGAARAQSSELPTLLLKFGLAELQPFAKHAQLGVALLRVQLGLELLLSAGAEHSFQALLCVLLGQELLTQQVVLVLQVVQLSGQLVSVKSLAGELALRLLVRVDGAPVILQVRLGLLQFLSQALAVSIFGRQLQAQAARVRLQLVRLGLVFVRLGRQQAVLLQQVAALALLLAQQLLNSTNFGYVVLRFTASSEPASTHLETGVVPGQSLQIVLQTGHLALQRLYAAFLGSQIVLGGLAGLAGLPELLLPGGQLVLRPAQLVLGMVQLRAQVTGLGLLGLQLVLKRSGAVGSLPQDAFQAVLLVVQIGHCGSHLRLIVSQRLDLALQCDAAILQQVGRVLRLQQVRLQLPACPLSGFGLHPLLVADGSLVAELFGALGQATLQLLCLVLELLAALAQLCRARAQIVLNPLLKPGLVAERRLRGHLQSLPEAVPLRHHPTQVGQGVVALGLDSLEHGLGRQRHFRLRRRRQKLSPGSVQLVVGVIKQAAELVPLLGEHAHVALDFGHVPLELVQQRLQLVASSESSLAEPTPPLLADGRSRVGGERARDLVLAAIRSLTFLAPLLPPPAVLAGLLGLDSRVLDGVRLNRVGLELRDPLSTAGVLSILLSSSASYCSIFEVVAAEAFLPPVVPLAPLPLRRRRSISSTSSRSEIVDWTGRETEACCCAISSCSCLLSIVELAACFFVSFNESCSFFRSWVQVFELCGNFQIQPTVSSLPDMFNGISNELGQY